MWKKILGAVMLTSPFTVTLGVIVAMEGWLCGLAAGAVIVVLFCVAVALSWIGVKGFELLTA